MGKGKKEMRTGTRVLAAAVHIWWEDSDSACGYYLRGDLRYSHFEAIAKNCIRHARAAEE